MIRSFPLYFLFSITCVKLRTWNYLKSLHLNYLSFFYCLSSLKVFLISPIVFSPIASIISSRLLGLYQLFENVHFILHLSWKDKLSFSVIFFLFHFFLFCFSYTCKSKVLITTDHTKCIWEHISFKTKPVAIKVE